MSRSPSLPEPPTTGSAREPAPTAEAAPDPAPHEPRADHDPGSFRDEIVADVVRGWRRDLADVGGPNTLLWFKDLPAGTLDLTTVHPGGVSMLMAGGSTRLSHLVRERTAFAEARRRAQVIREKTTELRDERGLVSCFMALGMATWHVPGAQQPQAPVLLRPCTIHPVDAEMTDFDLDLGLDIEVNPVLVNYLRHEQGIDVDPAALAELAAVSTRFDPMRVFRELARTCALIPGFSVTDRRVVTTFSYTKLPMVADLTEQGMALGDHAVLAALARVPGATTLTSPPLDDGPLDPGAELLALDADTTQSRVVADARAGRHLAVAGGPGTGKTRTIANLIAALAADGKSILLLEQDRASLSAVTAHLDDVGLSGLVLDAHGVLPDAQTVAREVVTALDRRRPARDPDTRGLREQLRDVAADLQAHRAAVHEPRQPWGLTVQQAYDALAVHATAAVPPSSTVRLAPDVLDRVDHDESRLLGELLTSVAAQGGWSSDWPDDPWYRAWVASAQDASRTKKLVTELAGGRLAAARAQLDETLVEAGLPPAETADHWDGAFELMVGVRKTLTVLPEDVYLQPLDYLLGATADRAYRHEKGLWLGWRSRRDLRRRAESLLSPEIGLEDLHDALSAAHEQRVAWTAWSGSQDLPRVPESLDESRAVWDVLAADLRWLSERLETTVGGGDLFGVSVDGLLTRLADLAERIDRVEVLPQVAPALDRCLAAGFDGVIADLASRGVPPERIGAEVDHIWWRSFLDEVARTDARIGGHDGDRLRAMVDEYTRLDLDHLRASRDEVRVALAQRLHAISGAWPDAESYLRHQAAGAGADRPVREIVAPAAGLLTAVKPCWAMSPLAVAALLPPGQWFDVVIVDDAAQLLVAHAVSGMSRGRQVIVVGDDRQPPPLPYTTAALEPSESPDPDETVPVAGGPTLLEAALDALPTRRLRWQYRARDALVAFANDRVYDGELVTAPGTSPEPAVRVVGVAAAPHGPAAADPSGDPGDVMLDAPGEVDPEVAQVVALLWEHARTRPDESLAVVTLSSARAQRMRAAIDAALLAETDAAVRAFVTDDSVERLVVAHVDRVVGAQRDAVILALGYTPSADGSLPRRFGRLDAQHGDRVLCAALGIARARTTIVTAVTLDHLEGQRLGSSGAALVRDLLRSVAADVADAASAAEGRPEEPLLDRLAERLRAEGLTALVGVGRPPLPVDVAVADRPSSPPVVAVLSDGATYASLDDVRTRERGRAEQLRRLGWEVVRVWGADLLADPEGHASLVREALRAGEARGLLSDRSRRRASPPRP